MEYAEYHPGRLILGNLPHGQDLFDSIAALCRAASVETGVFSVAGVVSSYTIGAYDPRQQVYVTVHETASREIASCSGSVTLRGGEADISAHIVLADDQGGVTGGALFPETRILAGEVRLREWTGPPPTREYDAATGRMRWRFPRG